jgi:hypothetical protein
MCTKTTRVRVELSLRSEFDQRVKAFSYDHMVRTAKAPLVAETAAALGCSVEEARESYLRWHETHALMLDERGELWRVAPFSAIPTAFPVKLFDKLYYANCAWDALGIPATLHRDAVIETACSCCNDRLTVEVRGGHVHGEGTIHIAIPARDWYKDVVFT